MLAASLPSLTLTLTGRACLREAASAKAGYPLQVRSAHHHPLAGFSFLSLAFIHLEQFPRAIRNICSSASLNRVIITKIFYSYLVGNFK